MKHINPVVSHWMKQVRMGDKPKLYQYTTPGMYTIIYLCKNGDILCADCAAEVIKAQMKHIQNSWSDVINFGTYDEGPPIQCDGCGFTLESSYGEVEENNE